MQATRPAPVSTPLLSFGAASLAALVVLLAALIVHQALGVTIAFALAALIVIEAARRAFGAPPWWIAFVTLAPWAVVVLLPWTYFVIDGKWFAVDAILDVQLPHTSVFHVVALVGLTIGTAVGMTGGRRPDSPPSPTVRWNAVSMTIGVLLAIYLAGFVVSGRSLSELWRLGGEVTYGLEQPSGALLFLDGLPVAASAALLVATAARRRLRAWPVPVELAWLAVLALQTFGSGVRQWFFLLVIGWCVLQVAPSFRGGRIRAQKVRAAILVCLMIAAVVPIANRVAELRSGGSYGPADADSAVEFAVQSVDVISSAEMLFAAGVRPGTLGGESYAELPVLLVPRRILGTTKPNPASDELVRERLSPVIGYSAPLWIEAALNFDWAGVFVFALLLGGIVLVVLTRARSSNRRWGRAVVLFGPVWVIVSYNLLSRLTLYGGLFGTSVVVLGVLLASRCIEWAAPTRDAN